MVERSREIEGGAGMRVAPCAVLTKDKGMRGKSCKGMMNGEVEGESQKKVASL
jgi:hypothetical protein